jgi:hypothetical protein
MNADESDTILWESTEQMLLLLSREQEWAEAYALDHPRCSLGQMYLNFLRSEIVTVMGEL